MQRAHLAAAGAVLALAAGAGAWYARATPEPPPVAVVPAARATTATATVHVSGAVVAPGLYEIARDARVADAVAAAGGALPGADLGALNLAAPIGDGQHLMVPSASAALPAEGSETTGHPIRVNSAPAAELEHLPGVGPVLAASIVSHRETFGPFAVVEDLLEVPGIGEAKLAAMREAVQIP